MEHGRVFRRPLQCEIECQRKKGRLKRTCLKQVDEQSMTAILIVGDAICWSRWIVCVDLIADRLR